MLKRLKEKISQFSRQGLFHIFGSSVFAKVGGIISSVVVVRNLPKTEYGSFVDADNLYAYLAIFIGLGFSTALVQYCSEKVSEERKNALYRYSLRTGMLGNLLLLPLVLGLAAIKYFAGDPLTAGYLATMCFLPFFAYADQYLQIVLRVKLKNKSFSRANMLYTIGHVGGNILFTLLWGVPGLIFSQYAAHCIAALYSSYILKKDGFFADVSLCCQKLEAQTKKEVFSYSLLCAVTNFASTALVLLDVTCLGLVLKDASVLADYKVAATIPAALAFVPKSLMTFFYPQMVHAFGDGKKAGYNHILQMTKVYALVNGVISLGMLVGAPLIIWLMYGDKYMNVVPIFQVLIVNYLVYSFRNITGNTILVLKKPKVNLVFSLASGVLNIALNLLLIPALGSIGAAYATLAVTCCIVAMNIVYLWRNYRKE